MYGLGGFDDERKQEARRCDQLWKAATYTLGFLTAASAIVFPVSAPFFGLAMALAPPLGDAFKRVAKDPPRRDHHLAVEVPPTRVDPLTMQEAGWDLGPDGYLPGAMAPLTLLAIGQERVATHMDATVTCLERAVGARMDARAGAGTEGLSVLRMVEARVHARQAATASWLMVEAKDTLLADDDIQGDLAAGAGSISGAPQQEILRLSDQVLQRVGMTAPDRVIDYAEFSSGHWPATVGPADIVAYWPQALSEAVEATSELRSAIHGAIPLELPEGAEQRHEETYGEPT